MPKNEPAEPQSTRQQSIEELQRRFKRLDEKRIATDANRETAQARLDELKADARARYGTDDIEGLKKQLSEMIHDNEAKRRAYQITLDAIELGIAEAERSFAEAQSSANPGGDSSGVQ